jgi:hypothetical protein
MTKKPRKSAKAKKRTARKAAAPKHPDHALIRACILYAQAVAADNAGAEADPDGNCDNYNAMKNRYGPAARSSLKACCIRAETVDGLEAKARIVRPLIEIDHSHTDADGEWFLTLFADDMVRYLRSCVHGEARKLPFDPPMKAS